MIITRYVKRGTRSFKLLNLNFEYIRVFAVLFRVYLYWNKIMLKSSKNIKIILLYNTSQDIFNSKIFWTGTMTTILYNVLLIDLSIFSTRILFFVLVCGRMLRISALRMYQGEKFDEFHKSSANCDASGLAHVSTLPPILTFTPASLRSVHRPSQIAERF